MGWRYAQASRLTIAAVLLCLGLPAVHAQQTMAGREAELKFSTGLQEDDDELSLRTDLGLSFRTTTRARQFGISLDGGLEEGDSTSSGIVDPRVRLSYSQENRNNAMSFDFSYREADISQLILEDEFDTSTLTLDEGTRERLQAGFVLDLGREAPIGATFAYSRVDTTYSDIDSDSLIDSYVDQADLRLRFDLNRQISARVTANFEDTERDGGIDLKRESAGVGATFAISPAMQADADIGFTRVEESGSVPQSTEEGTFMRFSITRELTNGTVSGSFESDIDENGRRSYLQIGRILDLPNGNLRASLGVSERDDDSGIDPVYSIDWLRDLPDGSVTVSFNQDFGTNDLSEETLNTRLRIGFQKELTALSRFGANLGFRNSEVSGGDSTNQVSAGLNYTHDLTKTWSFVGRYTRSYREQESGGTQTDDTIFVGLRAIFGWRP